MRSREMFLAALLVLALAATAHAQGLVRNFEFVDRAAGNDVWPAQWTADQAVTPLYVNVNDDGCADMHSLHYQARAGQPAGPLSQAVRLAANTEYVLVACLKSDGAIKPAVRLVGPAGQLAVLTSTGNRTWERLNVRFNSGAGGDAALELWGDSATIQSRQSAAGSSAIDGVNIYLPGDVPAGMGGAGAFTPPGPNIALNKPYTLQPNPNYGLAVDADDKIQLTDGQYTVGYFWTQKSTVGWSNASPVIITIDLQQVEPIAGLSYNTAAGVAGVTWPTSVLILVSDDGQTWGMAGDLMNLATTEGGPPPEPYQVHRFATDDLKTHGRYVKLFVDQIPYSFVDEVEVYSGPQELLQVPYQQVESDPMRLFETRRVHSAMVWRLRTDLANARAAIEASGLRPAEKRALQQQADALAPQIEALPVEIPADFKAILPLNDLHARIYALYAPLHRAQGLGPLTVWQTNRWDPLAPTQAPAERSPRTPNLNVQMMRNEYRGEAFNLTNASDQPVALDLAVNGLPGGDNPPFVSVREVPFTDTRERSPVAAALPSALRTDGAYRISIPAGMTRQVWLDFNSKDVAAGRYSGRVRISGAGAPVTLPLTLQVYPMAFPEQPTIHIGGWDYTNGAGTYDATPGNLQALITAMRANYVDTPWANAAVQPQGVRFDAEGNLTGEPNFDNWDEWVGKWPGARLYAVFLSVGNNFAGEQMGTPRFNRMIAEWITAWVQHMGEQDLEPEQLVLLLVDEPTRPEQYEIIKTWARAINAAQPRVTLFEDPTIGDPAAVDPEFWAEIDVVCPNLPMFLAGSPAYRDFYAAQKQAGRTLWFYSCSGPSKQLDPITYHRSQFWFNAKYGGLGSFYWAFGDEAGASSWNAYMQKRNQYSPLFLGPDSVTDAKHMAAIREGAQDYEYFVMLRNRIVELERAGNRSPLLDQARRLSIEGPDRVTATIESGNLSWSVPKDRGVMDQVRVEVLEMLDKLAKL